MSLHAKMMDLARAEAKKHVQTEDGDKCFNLFTFLEGLEYRLESVLNAEKAPNGSFQLSAGSLARYLWCCLAVESDGTPDGTTFKGMPILD